MNIHLIEGHLNGKNISLEIKTLAEYRDIANVLRKGGFDINFNTTFDNSPETISLSDVAEKDWEKSKDTIIDNMRKLGYKMD